MKIQYKLVALVIILLMSSCKEKEVGEMISKERSSFELYSGVSIIMANEFVHEFDGTEHQIIYTTDKTKYMVTNTQQSEYYSLIMDATPELTSTVLVEVVHLGMKNDFDQKTYTMNVVKIEDHKLWLWNETEQLGFILKY